jgi:hypothetical protein
MLAELDLDDETAPAWSAILPQPRTRLKGFDSMRMRSLTADRIRCEAIQDCGFGVFEVWQAQDRFSGGAFSS